MTGGMCMTYVLRAVFGVTRRGFNHQPLNVNTVMVNRNYTIERFLRSA